MGGEYTRVVDEVTISSHMYLIWMILLWVVIHDKMCICDNSVGRDSLYLVMGEYKIEYISDVPVFLSPCNMLPNFLLSTIVHTSLMIGSFSSFL